MRSVVDDTNDTVQNAKHTDHPAIFEPDDLDGWMSGHRLVAQHPHFQQRIDCGSVCLGDVIEALDDQIGKLIGVHAAKYMRSMREKGGW